MGPCSPFISTGQSLDFFVVLCSSVLADTTYGRKSTKASSNFPPVSLLTKFAEHSKRSHTLASQSYDRQSPKGFSYRVSLIAAAASSSKVLDEGINLSRVRNSSLSGRALAQPMGYSAWKMNPFRMARSMLFWNVGMANNSPISLAAEVSADYDVSC